MTNILVLCHAELVSASHTYLLFLVRDPEINPGRQRVLEKRHAEPVEA